MRRLLALLLLTVSALAEGANDRAARIVATSTAGSAAAPSTLLTDLSSYWNLDDAASGARLDSLGTNNLTDHNGVTQESGKILQAAGFNGSTRYLSAASSVSLQTGDINYTFAAWLYPTDAGSLHTVVSKGIAATSVEYVIYLDPVDGALKWQIWDDPPSAPDAGGSLAALTLNAWTHMVFVRDKDASKIHLYIDGASQGDIAISKTPAAHAGPFELGRYTFTGDRYWQGRIDGVGFWKRALNADEVAELYNAGVGVDYPF